MTSAVAGFDPHVSIDLNAGPTVYPDAPPPAPMVETQPVSPGPDYVWINGQWVWEGHNWRWDKGRWERPPHHGMHYVPNHYGQRDGKHVFTRGGWRD